jgi:integrase
MRYDATRDLWVAQVTIGGKRKTVARKTQRDCQTELDKIISAMRAGEVVTRRVGLTVADVLDHWLTVSLPNEIAVSGKGDAPGTLINHGAYVRRLTAVMGKRPVAKLTVDDVERAYAVIAKGSDKKPRKAVGDDYLRRMRVTLLRAMKDARRRRVVSDDVVRVVSDAMIPAALTAAKGERRALTADEMRSLLTASEPRRLHALFLLALSSGMRPGELLGLYWSDLHLDEDLSGDVPYLEVNHAVQRQANNRFAVVEELKTAGSYRALELSPTVVAALRAHRVAQNVERLAASSWPNPDLVFASTRGTILNPSNVRREFADVCKLAGVAKIVPNETRHTFATMLAESKMNTFQIVDILGHTNDRMINAHYRKKRKGIVRGSTAVVDQFLGTAK